MSLRCFSCENDDTADTALPVFEKMWDASHEFMKGQPLPAAAYQYRCSFCNGINVQHLAASRFTKDWHKSPSSLTSGAGEG